jgi:16S rRNA (guanine966-N2)-methyltransferase
LDVYAGSGALSLEALSRGAARAALVESSRAAARVAAANAEALGLSGRAEVACATVDRALAGRIDGPFDLVFLDPPYSLDGGVLDAVLASLATGELLAGHALVTVERSARDAGPDWPDAWEALGARRYGETAVHLAQTATAP